MWKCLVLIVVFLVILQDTEGWRVRGRVHTVCEHQRMTLRCPRHRVIRVIYALYGRTNRYTCSKSWHHRSTRCRARHGFYEVSRRCSGRRFCRVKASNSVFGDPCHGTFKYLRIRYVCRYRYHHHG